MLEKIGGRKETGRGLKEVSHAPKVVIVKSNDIEGLIRTTTAAAIIIIVIPYLKRGNRRIWVKV